MSKVNFRGVEYDGEMPLDEFAEKLGMADGFIVHGDAFKTDIKLETYETEEEFTAQEILDLC